MRGQVPQIPTCLTTYDLISGGATGWVLRVSDGIALKYCVYERFVNFQTENESYDLFQQRDPPPSILQSFLRLPGLNFMPLMAVNLEQRIHSNQDRDLRKSRCLKVLRIEPTTKIGQWAAELAGAIAWLESIGVVHGDLRPANILLDQHDHIKLADFDSVAKMGSMNPGNGAPWVRLRGREGFGSFGLYDACSEQFAFGSILHFMTTGIELYEDKGSEVLDMLENLELPELGDSALDKLTVKCWMGGFATLADLAMAAGLLDGAEGAKGGTRFDDEYMNKMKAQCQELLEGKLAGIQFDAARVEAGKNARQ
ncbi:protein kinase domain-containing protein [Cordyceps militaris CM01]|uniref:EKC/KEOPS complex subunit BUD32 n=1 Tax=Cordyceps militaris (strain CM01) TaxID=983644 RepID=G3J8C8_CORMM|nr:protein kinase domain-containing protein [Cordyceps militaris CM01]EGX93917.1 protein kinase domain-containing protein [Cordyceps militaris CM01]